MRLPKVHSTVVSTDSAAMEQPSFAFRSPNHCPTMRCPPESDRGLNVCGLPARPGRSRATVPQGSSMPSISPKLGCTSLSGGFSAAFRVIGGSQLVGWIASSLRQLFRKLCSGAWPLKSWDLDVEVAP